MKPVDRPAPLTPWARRGAAAALAAALALVVPLLAAQPTDAEVVRRAEELLAKIRSAVPGEQLERPDYDVVHTEHSKIAGKLATAALKVTTAQFGEQQLKLADVRSLRAAGATDTDG